MTLRVALWIILIYISLNAKAAIYSMPPQGDDVVGKIAIIYAKKGDNADKLMHKYEISYHELIEANPKVKFSNLQPGVPIIIPTQFVLPRLRKGIVINIPELRLYYFYPDGRSVFTTTVGLGRSGWRTPPMTTYIIKKEASPTWHVPKEIAAYALEKNGRILPEEVPPGVDNPLGDYAIYLSYNGYLLHGTNEPNSIGKYVSSGCIRLSTDAIFKLFSEVDVGTIVHIIHDSYKVGCLNNVIYMESHMPVSYNIQTNQGNYEYPLLKEAIDGAINKCTISVNWQKVEQVVARQTGIPEQIS